MVDGRQKERLGSTVEDVRFRVGFETCYAHVQCISKRREVGLVRRGGPASWMMMMERRKHRPGRVYSAMARDHVFFFLKKFEAG